MQKISRVKNDIQELSSLTDFIEEAVSNIIISAYEKDRVVDDAVDIRLEREGDLLRVTLSDHGVEYVSSAGLRLFLMMQKSTAAEKGSFRLTGMRPEVHEVFSIMGFSTIFRIE